MSAMEERIRQQFGIHIETAIASADTLPLYISAAATRLVNCLLNNGKILICGNGGSAANGLHFSAAMIHQFDVERPPLPVISLNCDVASMSSIAGDSRYDQVFARQIQALGQEGDVLVVVTTSGNADSILNAVHAGKERSIDTIALTGRDGGLLASHLGPEDIEIRVSADHQARIQELHLFILNCFCDLIEQSLFGRLMG